MPVLFVSKKGGIVSKSSYLNYVRQNTINGESSPPGTFCVFNSKGELHWKKSIPKKSIPKKSPKIIKNELSIADFKDVIRKIFGDSYIFKNNILNQWLYEGEHKTLDQEISETYFLTIRLMFKNEFSFEDFKLFTFENVKNLL